MEGAQVVPVPHGTLLDTEDEEDTVCQWGPVEDGMPGTITVSLVWCLRAERGGMVAQPLWADGSDSR